MYGKILKNPLILKLSIVQFIAYFGSWFSHVAIYTLIIRFELDPITGAFVVAMYSLPAIILAPFSGAIVDKLPFKKFMIFLMSIELITTLMYLLITTPQDVYLLMLLIFIRMSAASLFFTTEMTLLPNILFKEDLQRANELHSIIWSVTFALGMALGGVAVDIFDIKTVFIIDALLFLIAIVTLLGVKIDIKKSISGDIFGLIKSGFIYLKDNRLLLKLILLHSIVGFTTFDTLVNLLTDFHYKYIISVPLAIGWINAIRATALLIGPLLIGKLVNSKNLEYFLYLQGVFIILWAFIQDNFYLSLFGMFFVGFFTTTLWSYTYTLLQTNTQSQYLGRVIAYNDMFFMIICVSTTIFIGYMAKLGVALWIITMVLGSLFILSGLYYKRFQSRYLE
jgi:MFS family permease